VDDLPRCVFGFVACFLLVRLLTVPAFIGVAVFFGAFLQSIKEDWRDEPEPPRPRPWLLPAAVVTITALAVAFLLSLEATTENLAQKLMRDGDFQSESTWEGITRFALGIRWTPAAGDGLSCARQIAWDGDRAWVIQSPQDRVVEVRAMDRDELRVAYSTRTLRKHKNDPPATSCWKG
jgi:hypothetical protein